MSNPETTCPRGHSYVVTEGSSADCPICAGATAAPGDAPTIADLPTRDAAPADAQDDSQDQHAGPFRIVREHARGGLGRVSVAVDEALRREVAVKQMRPETADHFASRMRFVAEAVVTGQLEHPGIVPVYAFGLDAEGLPYYAMRFVRGQTFDAAIRAYHAKPDRLAFRDLLRRFVSVCQAIAYAHARHVIHRDIKPQNIMLGEYGETLILDWGLAKRLDAGGDNIAYPDSDTRVKFDDATSGSGTSDVSGTGSGALTLEGSALGTPGYMAPEQASGDAARAGPAADVYSLGATLMHVLDGKPPPPKGSPEARLDELMARRDVSKPLVGVCRRAMSARPTDRYNSADELAREIDRWLADEPVLAFREPFAARVARWARRHKTGAIAGTIVLIIAVVALAITSVLVGRQKRVAEQQRTIAVEERARAELQLARSLVAQGNALTETNRVELSRTRLDEAYNTFRKLGEPTLAADLSLGTLFGHSPPPVNLLSHVRVPHVSGVAFAPDGRTIFASGHDDARGALVVRIDAATGRVAEHPLTDLGAHRATALALAPDGKTLALATDAGDVRLWDADRKQFADGPLPRPIQTTTFEVRSATNTMVTASKPLAAVATARVLAFSPDGSLLVAGRDDGTATVWRIADRSVVRNFDAAPFGAQPAARIGAHSLSFSRDGNLLLVSGRDLFAMVFDLRTGLPSASLGPHPRLISGAVLAEDAKSAVTVADDPFVRIYNVEADRIESDLRGLAAPATAVALAADGQMTAAADADRRIMTWSTGTKSADRTFAGAAAHGSAIRYLRYSPDGAVLLSAAEDGSLCLWDARLAQQARVIAGASFDLSALGMIGAVPEVRSYPGVVALSPDGRLGLYGSRDATVLFDAATTRELKRYSHPRVGTPARIRFRADGREFLIVGPGPVARVYDLSGASSPTSRPTSGSWLAQLASRAPEKPARQFETTDGAPLTCGALAPDGTVIVADARGKLYVFPGATAASSETSATPSPPSDLAISSDGTLLLACADEEVVVFERGPGLRRAAVLRGGARCGVFVGARRVALGDAGGTIRIWDIDAHDTSDRLVGHSGPVNALSAASSAGGMLVSGGADHSVKVWDLHSMTETQTFLSYLAPVRSIALEESGRFALTGADDGIGAAWDFGYVPAYRSFEPRVRDALERVRAGDAPDPEALATLGRWYAFRGQWTWAADLLESARRAGAKDVSSLTLARSFWMCGKRDEARAEFERAIRENEAPEPYLRLCINAIDGGRR